MANELMIIAERIKSELVIDDYSIPEDFNMESALKAAAIIWRENNDFKQCTPESKHKAIMDMMVQGLNPLKAQCAFIPYGNVLQCIRQYPGSIMVAKREDPRIIDIRAQVIRKDDVFDYEMVNGLSRINSHKRTTAGWNSEIVGTYAVAVDADGNIVDMDMMSIDDIKNTWRQTRLKVKDSKTKQYVPVIDANGNIHPDSNHAKYPERMYRKTVIQRLCRQIISSSPNSKLLLSAERTDEDNTIQDDIRITLNEEANSKMIDFPTSNDVAKPEIVDIKPMANQEHFDRIRVAYTAAKMSGNVMDDISGFVGREVKRVRDLTADEAEDYIRAISIDPKPDTSDRRKPNWGN